MSSLFLNDPKDRKRRFLRGLNTLLGLDYYNSENKDIPMIEILWGAQPFVIKKLRTNLANVYCLEFTEESLVELIDSNMTTGEFTEKYCPIIYQKKADLNSLIGSSMKDGAIDLREMDNAPKYGINGREWCDVSEGPCSCGAYH